MTIFVVISCSDLGDRIRDAVDAGRFSDANDLTYKAKALADKLQSVVSERGGHLHVNLIDRQVLECAQSVAEDLPMILEGYFSSLPDRPAVGMGMSFYEASTACKLSRLSEEIEMYDPEDERYQNNDMFKADGEIELPINMFDPTVPQTEAIAPEANAVMGPDAQTELQVTAEYVQAIAETLMPPPPPMPAQQPGQEGGPRDLREALEGGSVPGYEPGGGKEEGESDDEDSKESKDDEEDDSETEKEEDTGEGETDKRLVGVMHTVQAAIPQLMELQTKDPKAFKAAHKLIDAVMKLARERQVQKAEKLTEDLNKALQLRLPVHSRKDNSKKVVKDGKQVWRKMAAGQVKDLQGEAISVKSSNKLATTGK